MAVDNSIGNLEKKNERTEIIYGQDNIVKRATSDFQKIRQRLDSCTDATGPSVFLNTPIWKEFIELRNRGVRLRFITVITQDNLSYSKELMKIAELRHLDGIKGNFGISDGKDYGGSASVKEGEPPIELIRSNVKTFVEQQQFLFETLWSKAIPAEQRIGEIEKGAEVPVVEVIQNSSRAKEIYIQSIKNAAKEIMIVFPTPKAFVRQDKIGVIEAVREAARYRNVKVKILMPMNDLNNYRLQLLTNDRDGQLQTTSINPSLLSSKQPQQTRRCPKTERGFEKNIQDDKENAIVIGGKSSQNIEIRHIERASETKATILIVDKRHSFVMELQDDSADTFEDAIGLSTYSNSAPGVLSYVSIFESLWKMSELYEQLKAHDKMQIEFINVAAHELRTPVQPILILSEMIEMDLQNHKHIGAKQLQQDIATIIRNAKRLQKLTRDILDTSKVETNTLKLDIQEFDLWEVISNAIKDCMVEIDEKKHNIVILCNNDFDNRTKDRERGNLSKEMARGGFIAKGDKNRISQVIHNLLSNAVKFTKNGHISVTLESRFGGKDKEVIVNVVDTGKGINDKIFPKLFTKFATDSSSGTGLGLYLSKKIIEAHAGKMWAKNNEDGKGATFSFSLPM
ncbi:MAG: HAMP domain-containing histidine kinase [Thermoproteota archaeon]|nr:HAMP domain-containing histidine kinase [Thermoproteota archaeon]